MPKYSASHHGFLLGLVIMVVFLLLTTAHGHTFNPTERPPVGEENLPAWDARVEAILGAPIKSAQQPGPIHELRQGWDKKSGRHLPDSSIQVRHLSPAAHAAQLGTDLAATDVSTLRFRSGFELEVGRGFDAALNANALSSAALQEPRYGVVQFTFPFPTVTRYELEKEGFRFYNYVEEGGLYTCIPAGGLDRLAALMEQGLVRYSGPIPLEARVEPRLLAVAHAVDEENGGENVKITLQLFDPPDDQQLAELADLVEISATSLQNPLPLLEGTVQTSNIMTLAQLPYVRWIELRRPMQILNLESTMALGTDLARKVDPAETTGGGIQVGVTDSGIATDPFHQDLPPARIGDQYDYVYNDPVAEDANGHGTHVAGTIGGSGASIAADHRFQGHAPAVEFLIYRLADELGAGYYAVPFQNSLLRGTNHGLDIVNLSWGAEQGKYETRAEIADRAVRGEYGDRYLTMVAATGNNDGMVMSPSIAKNVISVGAVTDGNRPDEVYSDICGEDRIWPPAKRACYSNHGPVDLDGDDHKRIKPDVMAPGTMIASTTPGGDGHKYTFMSGTSMAAPAVSGAAAAFLDHYADADDSWIFEWPEVVKAMMIACTLPVGDDVNLYGHGLVDTLDTIFVQKGITVPGKMWATALDKTGTQVDLQFEVPAGYKQLRLVLAWADPAGAAEVVHNLDLRIYNNATCSGQPIASSLTKDDTVEPVTIGPGQPSGTWCARVSAVSLTEKQPFALAYSGILKEPDVTFAASISEVKDHPEWRLIYSTLSNEGATVGGSFMTMQFPEELELLGARIYAADGRSIYYTSEYLYHPPGNTWYIATGALSNVEPRLVRWLVQIPEGTPDGTYRFQLAGGYRMEGKTISTAPDHVQFYIVDAYENDDVASRAVPIAPGESQERSLVPNIDADWATFTLTEPSHIELFTSGPEGDTMLALFDSDEDVIVSDDNSGSGQFSRIERTCAADQQLPAGRYYVEAWSVGDSEIPFYTLQYRLIRPCSAPQPQWRQFFPVTLGDS